MTVCGIDIKLWVLWRVCRSVQTAARSQKRVPEKYKIGEVKSNSGVNVRTRAPFIKSMKPM